MPNKKQFVISLGGSVICPDDAIDIDFLVNFRRFILSNIKNNNQFIIIAGGGGVCRRYQKASQIIAKATDVEQDWVGIETTKLNALLLKTIFRDVANPQILSSRLKIKNFGKHPLIIGCGWTPGSSSDLIAVKTAIDFKINNIINLGKPAYVFTKNPDKFPDAEPIERITWQDFFKLFPAKWMPGMNAPFDPIAGRLAKKSNLKVIVADGKNIPNFSKILQGKAFKGTIIK